MIGKMKWLTLTRMPLVSRLNSLASGKTWDNNHLILFINIINLTVKMPMRIVKLGKAFRN